MKIHKLGILPIAITLVLVVGVNVAFYSFVTQNLIINSVLQVGSVVLLTLVVRFFRNPKRAVVENPYFVLSPAYGKIVVIEETTENEYFKDRRLQVSIFMSIHNVHSNKFPLSGKVSYVKYHKGEFLLAKNPKSSEKNERNTVVVKTEKGQEILARQIAGAVARRIICYAKEGDRAKQGDEFGFIKFGSRVDLFLPLDAKIKVKLGDKVQAARSVIADLV